jgi:uncharacterized oxidoreductase
MADLRPVDAARLEAATAAVFRGLGSDAREAALIARHLVEANLMGHDSHGVGVIPMYARAIETGGMRLNHRLETVLDAGGMLVCEGGSGAGQVMAHEAMELGIARAAANGSAIVGLRNSHHVGRIGHWAEQCAAAGMVSMHFVNVAAGAFVAPFGGTRARLGTNPFAAGFPRPGEEPVIVDFATSRLAAGKVRVAYNKGAVLPAGALLDAAGHPTTDPAALYTDPPGALVTFGEHKGFGLALACELLGAALLGGHTQNGPGAVFGGTAVLNSMLSIIVSPEAIGTASDYRRELLAVLDWVQSENVAEDRGHVLLPGMPERATKAARLAEGIPLDAATLAQLGEVARQAGMDGLGV